MDETQTQLVSHSPKLRIVKSLEELCFSNIVQSLEEYNTEELKLLPLSFRKKLLLSLPIIDVCHLEETSITMGMDMDLIWKELYTKYIEKPYRPGENWREHFFMHFSETLLQGNRPSGYHRVLYLKGVKIFRWLEDSGIIADDDPSNKYLEDKINYLVATQRDNPENVPTNSCNLSTNVNQAMTYHQVTLAKGVLPPGKLYHRACQAKQLTPQRHTHYFSSEKNFLPTAAALELIRTKCHFLPQKITFTLSRLHTFLLSIESQEQNSLESLVAYFSNVDSLTIKSKEVKQATNIEIPKGICSKLLRFMLANDRPNLTSLTAFIDETDDIIESISPDLTSYHGLRQLHINISGKAVTCVEKLISITKHQTFLHTITINIDVKSIQLQSDDGFYREIRIWLQACFEAPHLKHLKISATSSPDVLLDILSMFISAPCQHEQTLTLNANVKQNLKEGKNSSYLAATRLLKQSSMASFPCHAVSWPFQYKSIELKNRTLEPLIECFLQRRLVKLKRLLCY